ncbi:MAG: hypothetical protein ABIR70_18600 [Bryobacteraceae bacterium]
MARVLDFIIYISVGLLLVAAAIWSADNDRFGLTERAFNVWTGGIAGALVVVGYVLKKHYNFTGQPIFWLLTLGLLAIHVLAVWFALSLREWKLIWWTPICLAEIGAIEYSINRFAFRPDLKKSGPK